MRNHCHIITLLACLISSLFLTGCHISELTKVEPDGWEKREFEKSVNRAVSRAVHTPGVDNGSTIIVTSKGDTLVAPTDTLLLRSDIRTVYVDIQAPEYPKGLTNSAIDVMAGIAVTSVIVGFILIIIIGIFVIVITRQHGRNRLIRRAIEEGYELPESFYTGTGHAPDITVNQIITPEGQPAHIADELNAAEGSCPPSPPAVNLGAVKDAVKEAAGLKPSPSPLKDLRNGLIMVGIGVVIFISFTVENSPGLGFFVGGILAVLGAAKISTYYLGNRR